MSKDHRIVRLVLIGVTSLCSVVVLGRGLAGILVTSPVPDGGSVLTVEASSETKDPYNSLSSQVTSKDGSRFNRVVEVSYDSSNDASSQTQETCKTTYQFQDPTVRTAVFGTDSQPSQGTTPNPPGSPVDGGTSSGSTGNTRPTTGQVPPASSGGYRTHPASAGKTIRDGSVVADHAIAEELLRSAQARRNEIQNFARSDQSTLENLYQNTTVSEFDARLNRAQETLGRYAELMRTAIPGSGGLDASEQKRFQNTFLNASDFARGARELIDQKDKENSRKQISLFNGMLDPNSRKASDPGRDLAAIFSPSSAMELPTSQDALVRRMVLFNGLPDNQRDGVFSKLKLAETEGVTLADGTTKKIPVLHNGYILGGGKSGIDCSSFVSAALPADVRKGHFTTLDYWAMWVSQKKGFVPRPPKWKEGRAELVAKTGKAFVPIDIYSGQALMPGDLLIYRFPWDPAGHIFIIKDYNRKTMVARVLEAAQSAGTIRERDFSLGVGPTDGPKRYMRGGFVALRLKPTDNPACKYKDKNTLPRKGGL